VTDHAAEDARERSPTAVRIFLCLVIIAVGLSLRRYGFGLGLPGLVVKYGGSILWAAMVFFLVALVLPVAVTHTDRGDRSRDRGCGRTVSAGSHAVARRVSPHACRRTIARPRLLAMGYHRLWRRDFAWSAARSLHFDARKS
jgi:hypothetical protein